MNTLYKETTVNKLEKKPREKTNYHGQIIKGGEGGGTSMCRREIGGLLQAEERVEIIFNTNKLCRLDK